MQTAPVNCKLASLSDMAKVLNSAVTTVSHWFVITSKNSLEIQKFPLVLTVGNRKRAIFEDTNKYNYFKSASPWSQTNIDNQVANISSDVVSCPEQK